MFFCVILVLKDFKTQVSGDSSNRLGKSEGMSENTYHFATRFGCSKYLQHDVFNTFQVFDNFWNYPQL